MSTAVSPEARSRAAAVEEIGEDAVSQLEDAGLVVVGGRRLCALLGHSEAAQYHGDRALASWRPAIQADFEAAIRPAAALPPEASSHE